jgi:hypothetical protein
LGEDGCRDRGHVGVAAVIGDRDLPERPKCGNLRPIKARAAQQPRDQYER